MNSAGGAVYKVYSFASERADGQRLSSANRNRSSPLCSSIPRDACMRMT
jgi:hypothetical protein